MAKEDGESLEKRFRTASGSGLDSYEPSGGFDTAADPDQTLAAHDGHAGVGFDLPHAGYELGGEIGRGGYGAVNRALQRIFNRTVAVKELLPEHRGTAKIHEFYAEAVVTAYLQHSNIVPIYDLVQVDGGFRLVMKEIHGMSWHRLLHPKTKAEQQRARELGLEDHLEILLKVSDAVRYAHDHGVLHRDLKPQNVMVGTYGEVILMDWGCAVTFGGQRLPGVRHVTQIDRIVGTPAYMSPEMARVKKAEIGPASDVYQLGGILYEILTGERPHEGKNARECVRAAAKGKIVRAEKRAPKRRVPKELSGVCRLAMRPKVADRIDTVKEFAARIRLYLKHREAEHLVDRGWEFADAAEKADAPMESYARSITCFEQALDTWQRCLPAKEGLVDVGLAYARCALAHDAFRIALNQATAVAEMAGELRDDASVRVADGLARETRSAQRAAEVKERHLRRFRFWTKTLALVLVIGLGGATVFSGLALFSMIREKAERERVQAAAAPAWVTRARNQLEMGNATEAREFVMLAMDFNDDLTEPYLILAQVELIEGRYPEAIAALETYRDLADRAEIDELIPLLAEAGEGGEMDEKQRSALTTKLVALGMTAAAKGFYTDDASRLRGYEQALRQAYPKHHIRFEMREGQELYLHLSGKIEDLTPLVGMPIRHLHLDSRDLEDFRPLKDLPLRTLSLRCTKLDDLSPLMGSVLEDLSVDSSQVANIAPLRDLPLRRLSLVNNHKLLDFAPLADMANLVALTISPRAQVTFDAAWLDGKEIATLELSNIRSFANLGRLADRPFTHLSLSRCHLEDVTQLSQVRAVRLSLADCNPEFDLGTFLCDDLRDLSIHNCQLTGLAKISGYGVTALSLSLPKPWSCRDLQGLPLEVLAFPFGGTARHVSALREFDGLKISTDYRNRIPVKRFWELYDLLQPLAKTDDAVMLGRARIGNGEIWELNLNHLPVKDLKFIGTFPKVSTLRLDYTPVSDLSPLAKRSWRTISLKFTQVESLEPLGNRAPRLDVLGSPIADLAEYKRFKDPGRSRWMKLFRGEMTAQQYQDSLRLRKGRPLPWTMLYIAMDHHLRGRQKEAIALADMMVEQGDKRDGGKEMARELLKLWE